MTFEISRAALERAKATVQAAVLLHDRAPVIARACATAEEGQLVVAVVRENLVFAGVRVVASGELSGQIERDGNWSLVFAPQTSTEEVEARCRRLARSALTRWEGMARWMRARGSY